MITKHNFTALVQTLRPEEIDNEIDKGHDYILFEAHFFNAGSYATIKSCDYDEDAQERAHDNGQIFCGKDDFMQLLEDTQALEY